MVEQVANTIMMSVDEYNDLKKRSANISTGYTDDTLDLAEMISNMPSPPNDKEGIRKWARRLANDISCGTD